jgi:site-specific DNA-methyltransferase (adenine-specific)
MINKIILGHAPIELKKLPDELVNCCVCSPPYWGLRDYGIEPVIWDGDKDCKHNFDNYNSKLLHENRQNLDGGTLGNPQYRENLHGFGSAKAGFCSKCGAWSGNLGLEPTFELYIKHLCDIFDEVKRVLRKDGTCWVNLGDTYASSPKGNKEKSGLQSKNYGIGKDVPMKKNVNWKNQNVPSKSLCLIPQRFVIEMVNRGWILRNTIIWHKKNCMPSSAKDRFTVDFEDVFFFTKRNKALFWTNEKTLECVSKQPLGTKGIEGKDWEWKKCSHCAKDILGTSPDGKITYHRSPVLEVCKRCKGSGKVKVSFWSGHDYWFEQQFENHLTQENRPDGIIRNRIFNYDSKLNKLKGYKTKGQKEKTQGPQYYGKDINYGKQGRNKRAVWAIPTAPFPEAHFACVDEYTEILTIDGWKKHTDIKWYKSSPHHILVATYNLEKQIIEYQPLSYIRKYKYSGNLLKIGNRDLDILTTFDHRNIVKKKTGEETIVLSEDLAYSDKIRTLAPVNYPKSNSIGRTFAELIGWIISEGHYKKGGYIEIYQNRGEKSERIEYLIKKLEMPYTKNTKKRNDNEIIFYLKKSPLIEWTYNNIPNKELNKLLISLPVNEIRKLFNGLIGGDGHIRKDDGRISFIQKNQNTRDWFQILALRLGYHSIAGKDIHLTKRRYIGIRNTDGKGKAIKKVKYNGIIWCPKTPNGTWVARRNGRIFITGNTFPEKLIEPMIKAGCPRYICKKCGKARVKIIESKLKNNIYKPRENEKYSAGSGFMSNKTRLRCETETIDKGYTDCGCNAGFEGGIVLDPFMGAGTTALVALKQRKRFIGIEIKPDYIDMTYKRIAKVQQEIF